MVAPALPIPSPAPKLPNLSQVSGDGVATVSIKQAGELAEIIVDGKMILTKKTEPSRQLSVPYNAWSPDNKYFFLTEKMGDASEYLVMKSNGSSFNNDVPYLMIRDQFAKDYPDVTIKSVTGWAAPTLIILNAKSENEDNMSFWFDVQTQKFIRLSTYFY